MPLVLANTTLTVPIAILSETTLSFLGLGDPTRASWGTMLEDALRGRRDHAGRPGGSSCRPGVGVVLVVLAFTLSGRRSRRSSTRGCGTGAHERRPELGAAALGPRPARHLPARARAPCPPCAASTSTSASARRSASPASRAAASRRSPARCCGCCRAAREVTGEVLLDGEDVLTMKPGGCGRCAGPSASIVFQGALHSLNPVQRIGGQIAEPILLHEPAARGADGARRASASCSSTVGLPARRARRLPAPALRRPAAARDDRDGAGLRPAAARSPTSRPRRST